MKKFLGKLNKFRVINIIVLKNGDKIVINNNDCNTDEELGKGQNEDGLHFGKTIIGTENIKYGYKKIKYGNYQIR